jgi:hypothetical protein
MSDDELSLRKAMDRGGKATALLKNLNDFGAFADVRAAIIEKWRLCPIRDKEAAHELKLMLKLLDDVEGHVKQAIEEGNFAAEQLKQPKGIADKIRERLRIA